MQVLKRSRRPATRSVQHSDPKDNTFKRSKKQYKNCSPLPFEKEVENYRKRALQNADENGKTMNNFSRNATLFIKNREMD